MESNLEMAKRKGGGIKKNIHDWFGVLAACSTFFIMAFFFSCSSFMLLCLACFPVKSLWTFWLALTVKPIPFLFPVTGLYSESHDVNMNGALTRARGPFTPSQWLELEHQALIYKYIDARVPIPSSLLTPIRRSHSSSVFPPFSAGSFGSSACKDFVAISFPHNLLCLSSLLLQELFNHHVKYLGSRADADNKLDRFSLFLNFCSGMGITVPGICWKYWSRAW